MEAGSSERFPILQGPTQSHRGSGGIDLGFSTQRGATWLGLHPTPSGEPLSGKQSASGVRPGSGPVHPGATVHPQHLPLVPWPCPFPAQGVRLAGGRERWEKEVSSA